MKHLHVYLLVLVFFTFSGCKHVDLQTKSLKQDGLQEEEIARGHALLASAWKAQGMDNMGQFKTYALVAKDHWRGLLGNMGKVWPESRSTIALKYGINTFDSQVTFLDGKDEGLTAGLQSWRYYEQDNGAPVQFKEKPNVRIRFGLSAYHYFFELSDRLKNAPIITAVDQKERDGVLYDRVFVTWQQLAAHGDHDQYRVWINRDTGLLEYAEYTLRDNYLKLPGYKMLYGSIRFSDFRNIDGVLIPFTQHIFVNSPKKDKKYLHKLTISDFAFDTFDIAELRPNPDIALMGDAKVNP